MSLAGRTLFSSIFTCRRDFFSLSGARLSVVSEEALKSAFRRACVEESVGMYDGVAEDVVASIIAAPGHLSSEDVKLQLRTSSTFSVDDAGMVRMCNDKEWEHVKIESLLLKVAAKIPSVGVSGAQLQGILEDEAPWFQPSAVGGLSLKDAIQRFPHVFILDSDAAGRWTVRSAKNAQTSKPLKSRGPLNIVDFCRRKALLGHEGKYTPLRIVMQNEGVVDKGLLRELVMNEEVSKALNIKLSVRLRPKRPAVNAFCFVDGDEIGPDAVGAMCKVMNVSGQSSRLVARRSNSVRHNGSDIIVPEDMPTYALLELKARELTVHHPVVLQDVIYMCSLRQFKVYAEHVSKLNMFPDADVYVCCPSKVRLVAEKQHVPL